MTAPLVIFAAVYASGGLLWATWLQTWSLITESVIETIPEASTNGHVSRALMIPAIWAGSVSVWPFITAWAVLRAVRSFVRDARTLDALEKEFAALEPERQLAIVRACSPELLRELRKRFRKSA